jgi:hypothetical protein
MADDKNEVAFQTTTKETHSKKFGSWSSTNTTAELAGVTVTKNTTGYSADQTTYSVSVDGKSSLHSLNHAYGGVQDEQGRNQSITTDQSWKLAEAAKKVMQDGKLTLQETEELRGVAKDITNQAALDAQKKAEITRR